MLRLNVSGRKGTGAALLAVGVLTGAAHAQPSPGKLLIVEGDTVGGTPVAEVGGVVYGTGVGGWSVVLDSSAAATSRIYGSLNGGPAGVLRTEGVHGGVTQTAFAGGVATFSGGTSTNGNVAYIATSSGVSRSLWVNDNRIAYTGGPTGIAGYTFGTSAANLAWGATTANNSYFYGQFTNGSNTYKGVFAHNGTSPSLVLGTNGSTVGGTPATDLSSIGLNASEDGSKFIGSATVGLNEAIVVGGPTGPTSMVTMANGTPVQIGQVLSAADGGDGVEEFEAFNTYYAVNNAGDILVTARTTAADATDQVLVHNGKVVLREGAAYGADLVTGAPEGADLNDDGDWAVVWDLNLASDSEAIFANGELLARAGGGGVDINGDGAAEAGVTWASFNKIGVGDRDPLTGLYNVYFGARIAGAAGYGIAADEDGIYAISVPEPTGLAVLACGAVPFLASRRRARRHPNGM